MDTNRAKMIAVDLIEYHGLNYSFRFDNAVRRFGYASWRRKIISLSLPLVKLNDETKVIDTVLHEIAHGLTEKIGHAVHGPQWQRTAKAIGCSAVRCYSDEVITPKPAYIGICPNCQCEFKRFRRKRIACGKCCKGIFNLAYLIKWK